VEEGYRHLKSTQCGASADYPGVPTSDGKTPTGGVRPETEDWPRIEGETNLNTLGGSCGMPTQFLKTVSVGGKHRVARFMNIAASSRFGTQTPVQKAACSDRSRKLYIPQELLTLRSTVALPQTPPLSRFLKIAWDGVGTVDSAWDTCQVGCAINVTANRLCGGDGLASFTWEGAPAAVILSDGPVLCAGWASPLVALLLAFAMQAGPGFL